MGRITKNKLVKGYHKIFDCVYDTPTASIIDIAHMTKLSRNTVSKYLKLMYESHVMIGPEIRMRSSQDYKEYVYLLNFQDPGEVFRVLKGFPHVVYHGLTSGHWNTMVVTNRLLNFSKLVGFQSVVYQDVKYCSYTPKVDNISWKSSFEKIYDYLDSFRGRHEKKIRRFAPPLNWSDDEWTLYHAFKNGMRKKVIPTLKKIKVRYESYSPWFKDIENHCSIHTGFYPDGYTA
ncbi:MAG: winged helix-turn-helix domain-containing protein, partial [Theionarchaea archaeon]|nr:winged helix-turn-helix domain-containing protein [Theionarchaea archaeon]